MKPKRTPEQRRTRGDEALNRVQGQVAIVKALIDVAADGDAWKAIPLGETDFTCGMLSLFDRVTKDLEIVRVEYIRLADAEYASEGGAR